MVKKKEVGKICLRCSKKIDTNKDHHVLIGTYHISPNNPTDEVYFHFLCFYEWFQEKVMSASKNQIQTMREQSMKILQSPMIQEILSRVQGSGQLMTMVQTPLDTPKPNRVKLIAEKIQNDRGKRAKKRGRKPKTKM